jgi:transposase-like protein
VAELSKDLGIHIATIGNWRKKYSTLLTMSNSDKKSKNWTPEETLVILQETSSLAEHELGEYLRKKGLLSAQLKEWREIYASMFKKAGRPKLDPEITALRKEKKELERDLRRKDKAMAELSARVILLKKSHEIFGVKEDDE